MSWNHTTVSTFAERFLEQMKGGRFIAILVVEDTGEVIECRDLGHNTIALQRAKLLSTDHSIYYMEEYLAIIDTDCDGVSMTDVFFYNEGEERVIPKSIKV